MNLQREATLKAFQRIYSFIWKAVDGQAPAGPVVEMLRDLVEGYITYTHLLVKRRLVHWLKERHYRILDNPDVTVENVLPALEFSLYGVLLGTATDQELSSINHPHKWQSAEKKYTDLAAGLDTFKNLPLKPQTITVPEKIDYEYRGTATEGRKF